MRPDIQDLRDEVRSMREQFDLVVMTAMRLEQGLTALRDEIRTLYRLHGDLRGRVETIEQR
jgi:hypothetical protein